MGGTAGSKKLFRTDDVECRLKEQECSSVEREQCCLGPVGREGSLIKLLLSTVKEK